MLALTISQNLARSCLCVCVCRVCVAPESGYSGEVQKLCVCVCCVVLCCVGQAPPEGIHDCQRARSY
jgi:hypothetical protein